MEVPWWRPYFLKVKDVFYKEPEPKAVKGQRGRSEDTAAVSSGETDATSDWPRKSYRSCGRRSRLDLLPDDEPFVDLIAQYNKEENTDAWLHAYTCKHTERWDELFELEVRLDDLSILKVTCSSLDTVGAVKRRAFEVAGISSARLEELALWYQEFRMGEDFALGAFECPWNGTRMELKDISGPDPPGGERWLRNNSASPGDSARASFAKVQTVN
eukprot:TRINITY_DN49971_c0_g1_i1.p1 TRINITY_DN49971_c0_g1~~TRINITY_DN49971_c0_g1_i1.p1  ORF type:complete len:215 (+),score=22.61 TRINITY_DN49971_c0_g1_i1:148-792(+)